MEKKNLNELIEYDDKKFFPKVLVNEPGYRMVLLNMRAKQSVPEHANQATVTVYVVRGHVTFYEGQEPCDLRAGELVRLAPGVAHHLEAHEDSSVLAIAATIAGKAAAAAPQETEELDLRDVPRPLRHPLVFQHFDALAVGESFRLVNDHDPVPLSRQIESLRPSQSSWEYIQRGPDIFRIRLRRIAPAAASQAPVEARPEGFVAGIGKA